MSAYIRTDDLCAGYRGKTIISDAQIKINSGEVVTLIGCNGAGKTTLLRTLAAQLSPLSGTVFLDGKSTALYTADERSKKMAVLLTARTTPDRMTCMDAVSIGRYPYTGKLGILTDNDKAIVKGAMERTGIASLADTYIDRISDGQRQLVCFAAAIAQQPKIMFLDEPTSYLDLGNKLRMMQLLRELASEGTAVVMTLHELYLAQRFSDRCICTSEGKISCIGTPEEIFTAERINTMFGVDVGTFIPEYGTAEMICTGEPQVFVVGGGGSGIHIYRDLYRRGIPFAAGVLHENDIEYPTAAALACMVVTEKAFEPVSPESIARAKEIIAKCREVICCTKHFGSMNALNRELINMPSETAD